MNNKLYYVFINGYPHKAFNTKDAAVNYCRNRFSDDIDDLINQIKNLLSDYKERRRAAFKGDRDFPDCDNRSSKYYLLGILRRNFGCRVVDVLNELIKYKESELKGTDNFRYPLSNDAVRRSPYDLYVARSILNFNMEVQK